MKNSEPFSTVRIYDRLNQMEAFDGKISILKPQGLISIVFNEYLWVSCDNENVVLNPNKWGALTHWHPDGSDDLIQKLLDIANGELIFIENKHWLSLCKISILNRASFEVKNQRYMNKKYLLIYTGNSIIKRNSD